MTPRETGLPAPSHFKNRDLGTIYNSKIDFEASIFNQNRDQFKKNGPFFFSIYNILIGN